jgi:hypothetical protein
MSFFYSTIALALGISKVAGDMPTSVCSIQVFTLFLAVVLSAHIA